MNFNSKAVVYTAVFGGYDRVPAVNLNWDCDFICFTDNPECVSSGWKVVLVQLNGEPPAQANRRYKMLANKYLLNHDCSLYIDANIRILKDPSPLFKKYLDHGVIAIPKHQDRNCAYAEAQFCIKGGRVTQEQTERQLARYEANGFPKEFGMTENGIIFRRHHDECVVSMMNLWWEEYCDGAKRDQLSLPYLIWMHKINVQEVIEGPRINKYYFSIDLHDIEKSKSFFKRLVRVANEKKHLGFHYLLLSHFFSLLVALRDSIRRGIVNLD